MGVDFSAVIIVGAKHSDVVEETRVPFDIPVYDRYTGKQTGTEHQVDVTYKVGGVEIEESVSEYFRSHGIEFVVDPETEEYIYGRIVEIADERESVKKFDPAEIAEALPEVKGIFLEIGITNVRPEVMLVLACN
jgi:hypothetical protein